jgi:hypothetical protein
MPLVDMGSNDSVDAPNCAAGIVGRRNLRIFDNIERERDEEL